MLPSASERTMTGAELVIASKAMLKVAQVDGINPAEVDLIKAFYAGGPEAATGPSFDALLEAAAGELDVDASAFPSAGNRELLVSLCIITAYADGVLSKGELALVRALAAKLNVAPSRVDEILDGIKDQLLAKLSHLPDAASVAKVARELG